MTTEPLSQQDIAGRLLFHVKHEAWQDMETFRQRLVAQNEVMNLVGPATLEHYWQRHVLDSAQLLNHESEAQIWADLGAGAGFPGIVLSIFFKHAIDKKERYILLIDSLGKRCRFLEQIVKELDLPARVIQSRVEDINQKVDVITARAFAPLPRLLTYAENMLANKAEAWILKGENTDFELNEARKHWRFELQQFPSVSDPRGRVLHLKKVSRVR